MHKTLWAKLRSVGDACVQIGRLMPCSGDVPEGNLETTWRTKMSFDRRLKCVDERAEPSAMVVAFYMPRRSEAKPS